MNLSKKAKSIKAYLTKTLNQITEGEKHLPKFTRISGWIIPALLPFCYSLIGSLPLELEFFSVLYNKEGDADSIMAILPLWLTTFSVLFLLLFQAHSIKWAFAFFALFFCTNSLPLLSQVIPTALSNADLWALSHGVTFFTVLPALNSALLTLVCFTLFFILRWILSFLFFYIAKKRNFIPKISQTEKEALLTGSPWIEKGFFAGHPHFEKLIQLKFPRLTKEEEDFLTTETESLCQLSKEWDLIQTKQLPQEAENFLKQKKFFGLIIPKTYKGLNFSAFAHAKVIEKLASHNVPLSIITAVPNSLGPAELLLKYGTEEQKKQYLPSLSEGVEWPCFGLTEVQAGSDASSIQSEGILFKEKGILKIRLNFSKRWITLSHKATLIGLAVRLKDPEHLYSKKTDGGISCLLVPAHSPGVKRGRLHDPMACPIYNGPIEGENVIVLAESAVIGGMKNAGRGWQMLTETLSAGRGITLPSLAVGCGKRMAYLTGTHAFVRRQFGLPIGKFEGVEEALADIAGWLYLMESTQSLTLKGLSLGRASSVLSSLTKYQLTEMAQKIAKKGMDIMGGAGLSLGPRNKIASIWNFLPLSITVEGANILTRSLMIYGQGLTKAHFYIYPLIQSLEQNSFKLFHQNFWKWIYQWLCNGLRALVFSLTRACLIIHPLFLFKKEGRAIQKLAWASSIFSFLSDLSLIFFGGRLKIKEKLSGRLADLLSFQYMAFALIWRYKQTEQSQNSWLKTQWGLDFCFSKIQESLNVLLKNYPHRLSHFLLKPLLLILRINPIGQPPSDKTGKLLATQLLTDEEFRATLCSNMHFPTDPEDQFQKLTKAYKWSLKELPILQKMKKQGNISEKTALNKKLISLEEYEVLQSAKKARWEAIQADSWTKKEYFSQQYFSQNPQTV